MASGSENAILFDANGYARVPENFKPSAEEAAIISSSTRRGLFTGVLSTGSLGVITYYGIGAILRDATKLAALRRSLSWTLPLFFMFTTPPRIAQETTSRLEKLESSTIGEVIRHNKHVRKNAVAGKADAASRSTSSAQSEGRSSATDPTEFDSTAEQRSSSQPSEFEYESVGNRSSGGYTGGLDADVSRQSRPDSEQSSFSSSGITMAELRNRNRTQGPASHSAPSQPAAAGSSPRPRSSGTSSRESFEEERFRPSDDMSGRRDKSGSKYGDSGFS